MMNQENRKQKGRTKNEVVLPIPETKQHLPKGYQSFINTIKHRIANSRSEIIIASNASMICLYWEIGNAILKKQSIEGWGAKVIDLMSYDLKEAFPEMSGFSPRNLKYMRKFCEAWNDFEIVQRTVALIP
ncbi:MAG: hypothetical protein RIQ33_667 [Bacteroidota bacterium]|jgi:predicted nuclease of restriction endonuclease-like (RecB) superfamily